MIKSFKEKLTDALIKVKILKASDLEKALAIQRKSGGSLSRILVENKFISERELMAAMSEQLNIPPIDLSKYKIDKSLAEIISEKTARQYNIVPVSKIGKVLTVAVSDPLNLFAMDDLKMLTNYQIDPVIAGESDIASAISNFYGARAQDVSKILQDIPDNVEVDYAAQDDGMNVGEVTEESKSAPIIKIVSLILNEALKRRSSDIHIEPREKDLRIRYRIDGSLREAFTLPKKNQNAVIARIKIMSKLDITQTRVPQDGRFKINFDGKEIDFRVSVLPIAFGGKIVLRALDKANLSSGIEKLGFLEGPMKIFKTALEKPYGMILVTGPTGSGKSTTLYSIITQLNKPERNIITLEDPVEYELGGITQIPARPEIGLTFASGLKSVLRQSPDIVMVGEIRDFETADIAIKASLTGQLILSTLHTNDSAGAITRLIDMGVEPFLVASSVILVSAQRLIRKICPDCKTRADIPDSVLKKIGLNSSEIGKRAKNFSVGKGCGKCNNTGYYGRLGILEALLIDDSIRDMIMRKASSDTIKEYAVNRLHMMTLRDNAVENLINGITSFEEVLRVTSED